MQTQENCLSHRRRIHQVVLHINQNPGRPFTLDRLAQQAWISPFHLIRVFEAFMGETPGQYIIRKRMERAGFFLLEKKEPVTNIALDTGYETPSSFSKAFKAHFGIPPRQFREGVSKEGYRLSHHMFRSVIGNRKPSLSRPVPALVTLPEIRVIYVENQGVVQGSFLSTNLESFARFRQAVINQGLSPFVAGSAAIYPFRAKGNEDADAISFVGGLAKRSLPLEAPLKSFVYPPGKYAVFRHYGGYEFIMQTWNQAYMNWFPKSRKYLRPEPPMEIHLDVIDSPDRLQLQAFLLLPIQ